MVSSPGSWLSTTQTDAVGTPIASSSQIVLPAALTAASHPAASAGRSGGVRTTRTGLAGAGARMQPSLDLVVGRHGHHLDRSAGRQQGARVVGAGALRIGAAEHHQDPRVRAGGVRLLAGVQHVVAEEGVRDAGHRVLAGIDRAGEGAVVLVDVQVGVLVGAERPVDHRERADPAGAQRTPEGGGEGVAVQHGVRGTGVADPVGGPDGNAELGVGPRHPRDGELAVQPRGHTAGVQFLRQRQQPYGVPDPGLAARVAAQRDECVRRHGEHRLLPLIPVRCRGNASLRRPATAPRCGGAACGTG